MKKYLPAAITLALFSLAHAGVYSDYEVENYHWTESGSSGTLLKESGPVSKVSIGYEDTSDSAVLRLDTKLSILKGKTNYDGQTQVGTPATSTVQYSGFSLEGGFKVRSNAFDTPSTKGFHKFGIYYDKRSRALQSTSTAQGYTEDWTDAGVYFKTGFEPRARGLFGNVGLRIPITVTNSIAGSSLGSSSDLSLSPKSKPGFQAELGYKFGDYASLSAFYTYQQYGQSDPVALTDASGNQTGTAVQPDSKFTASGLRLRTVF